MNANQSHDAFIAHLRVEHRHLRELVRDVLQHLDRRSDVNTIPASNVQSLCTGLKSLREEVARHFRQEESGGCLEEAVSRCPSLADEAARLEKEHKELLSELDNLLAQTQRETTGEKDSVQDFESGFRQFVEQLENHEAQERRILQSAFGTMYDGEEFMSH